MSAGFAAPLALRAAAPLPGARLDSPEDRVLSPYSGYTRQHWLEVCERLLAGVLSCLDPDSGLPVLTPPRGDDAHYALYSGDQRVARTQAMERMMILAVIYTAATGRDSVPGYQGSITEPFRRAIARISSPQDPLYCGGKGSADFIGSETAIAILVSPGFFWAPFNAKQQRDVLAMLRRLTTLPSYDNHHHLFHMVPAPVLAANDIAVDRAHFDAMLERVLGWRRGNGWFLDGSNGGFDWYNAWGFHVYANILCRFDSQWNERYGEAFRGASRTYLDSFPYFFGRDGAPAPWGRSLAYRFACLAPLGWAALNDALALPPGQARRLASGCLKYFWRQPCLGPERMLTLGYLGENSAVAEDYLTLGTCYFAAQGLSSLLLPEDHPFWTAVEEPIPADARGGRRVLQGPQMVVRTRPVDGETRVVSAGQPFAHKGPHDRWQRGAKYFQHAYSSVLGFCVDGDGGKELGAGRTGFSFDQRNWSYREQPRPIRIERDHVASVYEMDFEKAWDEESRSRLVEFGQVTTHTLIGSAGEVHFFWHNSACPVYLRVGGYGVSLGTLSEPRTESTRQRVALSGDEFCSFLQVVDAPPGAIEVVSLQPRPGWKHTHLFGGKGAYPYWTSADPVSSGTPVVVYVDGARGRPAPAPPLACQRDAGQITLRFEGKSYKLPLPY